MFEDNERLIFRYNNGHVKISADPLTLYRKMAEFPELAECIKTLSLGDAASTGALAQLLTMVRTAFALPTLNQEDESGLTDLECIAILLEYGKFMEHLKKKISTLQTSPTLSEDSPEASV